MAKVLRVAAAVIAIAAAIPTGGGSLLSFATTQLAGVAVTATMASALAPLRFRRSRRGVLA